MKSLLVLDFDNTITDWDGSLKKERADWIAKRLWKLQKKYKVGIVILSIANRAHILYKVRKSKSKLLQDLFNQLLLITEERHDFLNRLNAQRNENQRAKNRMLIKIFKDPHVVNMENLNHILAYKKTNSLKNLSYDFMLPPNKIYFLDDNPDNIKFASHFKFNTFLVNNYFSQHSLYSYLEEIEKKWL